MHLLDTRVPPPIVALIAAAGMWWLARATPIVDLPAAVRIAAGVAIVVVGFSLDLIGLVTFRRARTTVSPLRPGAASALVTTGIYRYTRNPMYVGLVVVLLGWAVYLGSITALAGPVLFALYITRYQILPEERVLEEKFGEAYAGYRSRVRRWL